MTNEEYNNLEPADKKLASEAYVDGFEAALKQLESFKVRVGSQDLDESMAVGIKCAASSLRKTMETIKDSMESAKEG